MLLLNMLLVCKLMKWAAVWKNLFNMFLACMFATGYASQHYLVPVPSQGKLGGLRQKGHLA